MKLAGVIYLYEISQPRDVSNRKPLGMLRGAVRNIVVATTKWRDPAKGVESKREDQLSSKWQLTLRRFDKSADSAWRIVDHILENKPNDPLELLDSLIRRLEEPEVGGSLNPLGKILDQVRKMFFHR
jgi:hypothetical protein